MKKNRSLFSLVGISVLISSFFVGTVAASGEYLLPTPTRNPRTPPPTPTAGGGVSIGLGSGADSFECPAGGVDGYGTVTPDAMWLAVCGQCLPTNTPYPTANLDLPPELPDTATPIIWVSGTPATPGPDMELTYTPAVSPTVDPTVTALPTMSPTPGYTCSYINTPTALPVSTYPVTSTVQPAGWVSVDQNNGSISYSGSWTTGYDSSDYGGSHVFSVTPGDYFQFSFSGTGVRFYTLLYSTHGKAKIYIDGVYQTDVDTYASSVNYHYLIYELTGLTNGSHTLKVEVAADKNPSSGGYYVVLDSLSFYQEISTPTPYPTYTAVPSASTGVLECPSSPSHYTCIVDQEGNHAVLTWDGSDCSAGCLGSSMFLKVLPHSTDVYLTWNISAQHTEYSNFSNNRVSDTFSFRCPGNSAPDPCAVNWGLKLYGTPGNTSTMYDTWSWAKTVNTNAANSLVEFIQVPAQDFIAYAGTFEFMVEVWTTAQCFQNTPVPGGTSTPYPGMNYCSSINNGTDDLSNQDISFWTPSGAPICMTIPSYDTENLFNFQDIPWYLEMIGADKLLKVIEDALANFDVVTPAQTVCLQPYDFAPVYLFGNVLLFQTLADIVAVGYIISTLRSK
jgi:hypothetical protein